MINKIKKSLRNWPQKQAKMLDQALEERETLQSPSKNKPPTTTTTSPSQKMIKKEQEWSEMTSTWPEGNQSHLLENCFGTLHLDWMSK